MFYLISGGLCFKKLNLALGFLRVITNKNSTNPNAAMHQKHRIIF
jgi:hypothetical protein